MSAHILAPTVFEPSIPSLVSPLYPISPLKKSALRHPKITQRFSQTVDYVRTHVSQAAPLTILCKAPSMWIRIVQTRRPTKTQSLLTREQRARVGGRRGRGDAVPPEELTQGGRGDAVPPNGYGPRCSPLLPTAQAASLSTSLTAAPVASTRPP